MNDTIRELESFSGNWTGNRATSRQKEKKIFSGLSLKLPVLKLPDFLLPVLNLGSQFFAGFFSRFRHGGRSFLPVGEKKGSRFLGCPHGVCYDLFLI